MLGIQVCQHLAAVADIESRIQQFIRGRAGGKAGPVDTHELGGPAISRHDLHQPNRAAVRDRRRVAAAFLQHDCSQQSCRQARFPGGCLDQGAPLLDFNRIARRKRTLLLPVTLSQGFGCGLYQIIRLGFTGNRRQGGGHDFLGGHFGGCHRANPDHNHTSNEDCRNHNDFSHETPVLMIEYTFYLL